MYNKIFIFLAVGIFVFGISKLSSAMMCGDHGNHWQIAQSQGEHEHKTADATTQQAAPKKAVNVRNKICPVSGEKINEKLKATYEYEGKIYNFCCSMCIEEFKKDPQKYIKKVEEEMKAESNAKEMQQKMQMEREVESAGDQAVHRGHHH